MGVSPIAVGLAGAGPWAQMVHAPTLAAGPETRLAGVWSRTAASAQALAGTHGVPAFDSFSALLDACELVALAVPPTVQPDLAVQAARAGKALLLEKPLATDASGAARIVESVQAAGVGSVVLLTYRFTRVVRSFLEAARGFDATGGRACFLSGAFLGGAFAGGWRSELGALLDVGPHVLDLADAALGPVVRVRAHGDPRSWVGLLLDHARGATSEVSISCRAAIEPSRTEIELFGRGGSLAVDARTGLRDDWLGTLRTELAATAHRGGGHPCDAARGLHLQRVVAAAEAALDSGGPIDVAGST